MFGFRQWICCLKATLETVNRAKQQQIPQLIKNVQSTVGRFLFFYLSSSVEWSEVSYRTGAFEMTMIQSFEKLIKTYARKPQLEPETLPEVVQCLLRYPADPWVFFVQYRSLTEPKCAPILIKQCDRSFLCFKWKSLSKFSSSSSYWHYKMISKSLKQTSTQLVSYCL